MTAGLYLPNVSGEYVSSPHIAAYNITGDIELQFCSVAPDWSKPGEMYLVSRWGLSGQKSFVFGLSDTGALKLFWTEDGTTIQISTSSVVAPFVNGSPGYGKVAFDVDNGAGDSDITFYTSDDGTTWMQLGAVRNSGATTSIHAGTAILEIGSFTSGVNANFIGTMSRAIVKDGIDGTPVFDADFTNLSDAELDAGEFTEDSANAAIVTLNGNEWAYVRSVTDIAGKVPEMYLDASVHTAGIPKWSDRIGNNHHAQFGSVAGADTNDPSLVAVAGSVPQHFAHTTDDYFEIPDDTNLDFAAAEDFTLMAYVSFTDATPVADNVFLAKKADITTAAGYVLYLDTTGVPTLVIADGTASTVATGPALADDTRAVVTAVRDTGADTITVYTDGVAGTPVTDTTTATLANAEALRIGRLSGAGTLYMEGNEFDTLIFREALSAADIATIGAKLAVDRTDAMKLHQDALFGWMLANDTVSPSELVGALNELNGTTGVEYWQARKTYLGL